MNKQRLESEKLIYKVMDTLDPSGANTEYWKKEFADMSDEQFKKYISSEFPFYFQTGAFKEPSMKQISDALDIINTPLLEPIYMPFKYVDKDGNPMRTKEGLVIYIHVKRMKQLLTKKNGMSIDTKARDMRTGLLTGVDKNGKESDREFESLAVSGLTATMKELSRPRADSMQDKSIMNSQIKTMGQVRLSDMPDDPADSLSKNLLSVYFLGAGLYSNLVNIDYMTPYTLKQKNMRVDRES